MRSAVLVVRVAGDLPTRDLCLGVRGEGLRIAEEVLMVHGVDAVRAARDDIATGAAAAIVVLRTRHGGRAENTESNRGDHRRLSKLQHCRISKLGCTCRTCPIDRSEAAFIPDNSIQGAPP